MRYVGILISTLLSAAVCVSAASATEDIVGVWRPLRVKTVDRLVLTQARLEFLADGRVATTIGCNRIMGPSKIEENRLTIGPLAATRMACPGALGEAETKYMSVLEETHGFRLDLDSLKFFDRNGGELAAFERSK